MTGKEGKPPGRANGGACHLVERLQWTFIPSVPGPELDRGCRHTPNGGPEFGALSLNMSRESVKSRAMS